VIFLSVVVFAETTTDVEATASYSVVAGHNADEQAAAETRASRRAYENAHERLNNQCWGGTLGTEEQQASCDTHGSITDCTVTLQSTCTK
jgi:hypothetical protein